MEEEGIEAFVSIQSDKEMASLDVDYHALYEYTLSRGGVMHRFATCEQNVYEWVRPTLSLPLSLALAHSHTHSHTHTPHTGGATHDTSGLTRVWRARGAGGSWGMQVQQLPHALRTVIANLNAGRKTYVYGTQSQQRVAYILVMYFCWFEKLNMDEAMAEVGRLRPASKANVDLWLDVHGELCLDETQGQRQARLYTQARLDHPSIGLRNVRGAA